MKYSTILFDADGTLLDFKRAEKEAISDTFIEFNIQPTDENINTYSEINDSLWKALERGEIKKNVLLYHRFELFAEHYGLKVDAHKMAEKYMQTLSTKGHIIKGADMLCQKLYGKVKLYIVTNGVEFIQKGRFSVCPIAKYFENVFISGVIGYEKPDVRYFEKISSNICNFEKENTIIIGDSLTSDIKGGVNFNIDTCWYNPSQKENTLGINTTYIAHSFDEIYNIIENGSETV